MVTPEPRPGPTQRARAAVRRAGPQPGGADELAPGGVDVAVEQPGAGRGDEHRRVTGTGVQPVAQPQVAAERGGGGGMQRHQPGFAELGAADGQHAGAGVEVGAVQADRLTDPHAGDREQADQGLIGRRPQWGPQADGRGDQRSDLARGIQVGRGPRPAGGDQAGGRDLGGRVGGAQVRGEGADHREPLRMPPRRPRGQRRPRERIGGGDGARAGILQIGDELGEQLLGAGELVSQGTADCQVVGQRLA